MVAESDVVLTFSRERSPVMPSLPTAAEQGLSGVDAYTWNAIFLPKGTPPAIVAKLNGAVSRAMDSPAARARLLGRQARKIRCDGRTGARPFSDAAIWRPIAQPERRLGVALLRGIAQKQEIRLR